MINTNFFHFFFSSFKELLDFMHPHISFTFLSLVLWFWLINSFQSLFSLRNSGVVSVESKRSFWGQGENTPPLLLRTTWGIHIYQKLAMFGASLIAQMVKSPWVEKIPWRSKWQPTPVLLPGEYHGQRNLAGQRFLGVTKSWVASLSLFLSSLAVFW